MPLQLIKGSQGGKGRVWDIPNAVVSQIKRTEGSEPMKCIITNAGETISFELPICKRKTKKRKREKKEKRKRGAK